jgi:ASC-1-like (ASCH) protein
MYTFRMNCKNLSSILFDLFDFEYLYIFDDIMIHTSNDLIIYLPDILYCFTQYNEIIIIIDYIICNTSICSFISSRLTYHLMVYLIKNRKDELFNYINGFEIVCQINIYDSFEIALNKVKLRKIICHNNSISNIFKINKYLNILNVEYKLQFLKDIKIKLSNHQLFGTLIYSK